MFETSEKRWTAVIVIAGLIGAVLCTIGIITTDQVAEYSQKFVDSLTVIITAITLVLGAVVSFYQKYRAQRKDTKDALSVRDLEARIKELEGK